MGCLLSGIASLGSVVLMLGGAVLTLIGGLTMYEDHVVYQVAFKHSGDDCGQHKVTLDVGSGEPMFCSAVPMPKGSRTAKFPGFTDEQNDDVFSLAVELAGGGLSEPEQQRIQALVTDYAATVPPEGRPQHGFWWGANLVYLGVGAAAVGTSGYVVLRRTS